MLDILLSPFLLSVALVGMHAYFGLEIIRRGLIFTDLAIGQMAALGTAVGLIFFHGMHLYWISLSFALLGGGLIAWASRERTHLEALIGLFYAFGVSGAIILLSRSSQGMEEFQKLMASDILFTPYEEVFKIAGLYGLIGLVIYGAQSRASGFLKDLLFFITFSVTVTSSVKVAGVLVVFALLIAPALMSLQLGKNYLILKAWGIGILVNLASVFLSYCFDLPTGYTLVFLHSFLAICLLFLVRVFYPA